MKFLKEKNGGSRKQIITARPATIRLREKRQMQIASGAPFFLVAAHSGESSSAPFGRDKPPFCALYSLYPIKFHWIVWCGGKLEIKNSNEISSKFTPMAAPSALMTRTKASRIAPAVSRDLICIPLTLCLSTLIGRRLGSKSSLSGSMLMGDWRRPLLHSIHCGLIRPQNDGPSFA